MADSDQALLTLSVTLIALRPAGLQMVLPAIHPTRVPRIISVTTYTADLRAPNTRAMAILKEAGLVEEAQRGKRSFYRLASRFPSKLAESVVQHVLADLRDSPDLAEDHKLAEFMREYRIETMTAAQNLRQKRHTLRLL
ncbi:MAG: hypothetical protein C4335_08155 [Armatimonadota bacterium]